MKRNAVFILILVLISSCFSTKPLRQKAKAEKLIERAIRLDPSVSTTKTDTIEYTYVYTDTILVPGGEADSTFYMSVTDTVYIVDPSTGATARIIYLPSDTSGLTARIKASLFVPDRYIFKTDTVYIKVPFEYSQIKVSSWDRFKLGVARTVKSFWIIFMIAGVVILGFFIYKKTNPLP
jgi:hypothetical protein